MSSGCVFQVVDRSGSDVLVNFRNIGTAGLILGAKRGSAVPIHLILTSNATLGSGRISTSVF